MTLSSKDLMRWLNPWPISLKPRRWKLIVVSLSQCGKLNCFWRDGNGDRRTIDWWAKRASEGKVPDDRQHYLHGIMRFQIPTLHSLTAIALKRKGGWFVVDGNYHLISAIAVRKHKYGKLNCPLKYVGLFVPYKEKNPV